MPAKPKPGRGGARPGSGRKRIYGAERAVVFNARLDPAAYRVLLAYAERHGISIGRAASALILRPAEH